MRVLLVEDEPKMGALIRRGLLSSGAACELVTEGERALELASAGFDVVVLDVSLPGIDGLETCRRLRAGGVWTPVLMLTARGEVGDRVAGLDSGADDYLLKPFAFAELLARLRALTRREPRGRASLLEAGGLRLNPETGEVWRGEHQIELSTREFALLEAFMRHPGQVLSRQQLRELVWSYDYLERSNVVDVYVRYLRDKIDRPFGSASLQTVRGSGYRLRR